MNKYCSWIEKNSKKLLYLTIALVLGVIGCITYAMWQVIINI